MNHWDNKKGGEEFKRLWTKQPIQEEIDEEAFASLKLQGIPKILDIGSYAVLVINYKSMEYEFVSGSMSNLAGQPASTLLRGGFDYLYSDVVHPDDQHGFIYVYKTAMKHLMKIAPSKQLETRFAFDFRLLKPTGETVRVLQNSRVLQASATGKPILEVAMLTDITFWKQTTNMALSITEPNKKNKLWVYKHQKGMVNAVSISKTELKVLRLFAQGLTNTEVSKELSVSLHTVNTHRKNLIRKTGFNKINELVNYSISANVL